MFKSGCVFIYDISTRMYSQTCIQRSPLGERNNDLIGKVISYLSLVDLDRQFWSLNDLCITFAGRLLIGKNMGRFVILQFIF